jgi:hypothetical protein
VPLEVHPEQPELGQLGDQLPRKGPGREVLADVGQETLADKVAHRQLDEPLFIGEELIDGVEVCRIEAWPPSLSSAVGRHAPHCHIKPRAANGSDGPGWISARGPARWP